MISRQIKFIRQMILATSAMLLLSPFAFGKCEAERKASFEAHEKYDLQRDRCNDAHKRRGEYEKIKKECDNLHISYVEKRAALEKCEAPPPRPVINITKEECAKAVEQKNSLRQAYSVCINSGSSSRYCFDQACKSLKHIEHDMHLCNSDGRESLLEPNIPCVMVLPSKYGIPNP